MEDQQAVGRVRKPVKRKRVEREEKQKVYLPAGAKRGWSFKKEGSVMSNNISWPEEMKTKIKAIEYNSWMRGGMVSLDGLGHRRNSGYFLGWEWQVQVTGKKKKSKEIKKRLTNGSRLIREENVS